ncbi:MAG: hypothetical protein SCM11_11510 [Bacillota bacterium]|nr:hypothetical protein [Bacillota bacterium]
MPPLTFTAEESLRTSEIMGEVNTYYDEMVNKFIMGVEPLSKYDEYVTRINAMGIDEAIAIYQAALDRYNLR